MGAEVVWELNGKGSKGQDGKMERWQDGYEIGNSACNK